MQLFFFIGVVRVDQRQHDKGAEHVQYQCRHHEFGVQHGHVGADDRHGHRRHRGCRHGVHALFRHLAQDILVGDEVFGLAQDQRADGVERLQLAHAVHFRQHGTDNADDERQHFDVLQNTDQRRNEDDRAQHLQEEERQAFVAHAAEHEISPLSRKPEQFVKQRGESFYEAQTRFRMQEKVGQ